MRAWSRHRPDGAVLRAVTIVNGSTVRCVRLSQGSVMPLVNAASARRMILRMMRRERRRESQLNRRGDEPLSVVVRQSAMFRGCARCRALWAPARCALRWPLRRTEEVPCGTDVMKPTYALRASSVNTPA